MSIAVPNPVEVLHDHQVVGTHPLGATGSVNDAGDLLITNPDSTTQSYPHGTWHAWGIDIPCAYMTANAKCTRCSRIPPLVLPTTPRT